MGMSNAERQRKFRERRDADENRRREYLLKSRQKYVTEKAVGKRKLVKDMTERERRHQRKLWRNQKRKEKESRKASLLTPPASPFQERPEPQQPDSRQKKQECKTYNRQRAKCYRDLKAKEREISKMRKKLELYKKRWLREKEKHKIESPRTKTKNILKHVSRNFSDKKFAKIKQNLFVNNVVIQQIRQKYKEGKKNNKRTIASLISGSVLRKYGVHSLCTAALGIKVSRRKKKEKTCLSIRIRRKITSFYLRNDNSRLVSGMKNTKTHKKIKKQKRILLDTLKNLHVKFLAEGRNIKISYSLFCRLRPFWVVCPVESDRKTCLCKLCDNIQLQLNELSKVSTLPKVAEDVIKERVCSTLNKQCMYGICTDCKGTSRSVSLIKSSCENISWQQWQRKTERRFIHSGKETKEKDVSITVKVTCTGTIGELVSLFEQQFCKYMEHIYNCRSQYRYFKQRREHLKPNQCLVHIDFSENYSCKLGEEVQSMHFGASKRQITLQTGVYYIHGEKGQTFCTVSDSLQHGPAAIWCHLRKVLTNIKQRHTNLDSIEFFSDGPFAQYKQKGNFYLLTKIPLQYGFKETRWSFFESGHGKGIPDAVGGSLKREADRKVKYGYDINCAKAFVENMNDSKTKLWIVNSNEIEKEKEALDKVSLKPIQGTLRLHQVLVDTQDSGVYYRDLSCTCSEDCEHFTTKKSPLNDRKTELPSPKRKVKEDGQNQKPLNLKRTNEKSDECTEEKKRRVDVDISGQETDFKRYLHQLNKCKSFSQLQKECEQISREISALDVHEHHILLSGLEIDERAINYLPVDLSEEDLLPCKVHEDGNCLPSSARVFAYGNENKVEEMRVRIIVEQVKNEKFYLNDDFLQKGTYGRSTFTKKSVKKQYCQYSESYIPGSRLTNQTIKSTYRKEILSIRENRSYMGIWQIHALSSILKKPIYSIYPDRGNKAVRNDLNKLVKPVHETTTAPVYVLWNSTRDDMTFEHWIPNHFVPLLKVDDSVFDVESETMEEATCKGSENRESSFNQSDQEEECITIYIHDMTDGDEIGEANTLEKIDENEYIFLKKDRNNTTEKIEGDEMTELKINVNDVKLETDENKEISNSSTDKTEIEDTDCEKVDRNGAIGENKGEKEKEQERKGNNVKFETEKSKEMKKVSNTNSEKTDLEDNYRENKVSIDTTREIECDQEMERERKLDNVKLQTGEREILKNASTTKSDYADLEDTDNEKKDRNDTTGRTESDQETEREGYRDDTTLETDESKALKKTLNTSSEKDPIDEVGSETLCKSAEKKSKESADINNNVTDGINEIVQEYGETKVKEDETVVENVKGTLDDNGNEIEQLGGSVFNTDGFDEEKDSNDGMANSEPTENATNKIRIGNHVIVDFNGKPFVGLVKEIGLSNVLVECMRRGGKAGENSFSWPKKIKDLSWYQVNKVVDVVDCVLISDKKNKYKLDNKSWLTYLSHC